MKEEALLNAWHCNVPIIRRLRNLGLCHISAGNSDISARLLTRQAGPRRDLKAWNASWGAYGAPDLETALVMPGDFCKLCATSACTGRLKDWTDPLTAHGGHHAAAHTLDPATDRHGCHRLRRGTDPGGRAGRNSAASDQGRHLVIEWTAEL